MTQDKELREEQQRRKRAEATAQHDSKEKAAVKEGKKPFYLKKCKHFLLIFSSFLFYFCTSKLSLMSHTSVCAAAEIKKEELVGKFQELKVRFCFNFSQ